MTRMGAARSLFGVLVVLTLWTVPAAAQQPPDVQVAEPLDRRPKIAVGLGGDLSWGGGGGDANFLISVPVNERYSLEGFGGRYRGSDTFHTTGVYGIQVKRLIDKGREPGVQPFLTYGAMGVVASPEKTVCRSGTCVSERTQRVYPPIVFLAGVGAEFTVKPRLIVRTEIQGGILFILPISVHASISVAIPLGRARR